MIEIIKNLFLSSYNDIEIYEPLSKYFIINCSKDLEMKCDNNIRLSIDDNGSNESINVMYKSFENICDIIETQLNDNKIVIVHCLAGIQRSPTVICAYLMIKKQYQLQDAILFIKSKKTNIFFHKINFIESLQKLQLQIINDKIGNNFKFDENSLNIQSYDSVCNNYYEINLYE